MTVATIIGALRACSLRDPADVLTYLNRVLQGQITGFVTCTAARVSAGGVLTLSNAGNLPPYRNGDELEMESGLPLGITADTSYSETTFELHPTDSLAFISDGVVEATNECGELFGFQRTQAISTQSAVSVADAARQFGQQDDITVLTLTISPLLRPSRA